MGKGLKDGRGSGWNMGMIFLITPVTQLLGNSTRESGTCKMDEAISPWVFQNPLKGFIPPFF
jgi:hypothetical protein